MHVHGRRIVLVGRAWREGVEGWLLTPHQEPTLTNIKPDPSERDHHRHLLHHHAHHGGPPPPPPPPVFVGVPLRHELDDDTRWTGLPSLMGILHRWMFRTPADAAALVAILRARVDPDHDVAARLRDAFRRPKYYGEYNDERVSFGAFKLKGLPDITFVWRCVVPCRLELQIHIDDGNTKNKTDVTLQPPPIHHHLSSRYLDIHAIDTLYLLEGEDPTFRLLHQQTGVECIGEWGPRREESALHLPRFLALRARLRAALPALASIPDATLIALIERDSWARHGTAARSFPHVRLMPGHPERGDGQPSEWEATLASHSRASPPVDLALHADKCGLLEPTDTTCAWTG